MCIAYYKDNNRHTGRVRLRRTRSGIQKPEALDSGYPPAADSGMTKSPITAQNYGISCAYLSLLEPLL